MPGFPLDEEALDSPDDAERLATAREDEILAEKAANGVVDAAERLIEEHYDACVYAAYAKLSDRHLAENAAQDAMMKLFAEGKISQHDPKKGSVRAFMMITAKNCAIDMIRRRWVRPIVYFMDTHGDPRLVDPNRTPEELINGDENKRSLWALMWRILSPEQYRVLAHYYLLDRAWGEVAEVLDLDIERVRRIVDAAKKTLRRHADKGEFDDYR